MAQVQQPGVTSTPPGPPGSRTVNLGRGLVVPYPEPASEAATRIGRANARTNTKPEVMIRSAIHRRGLRFRKDHLLRIGGLRVKPDVVFTRWKVAAFVDGCFWHQCPEHCSVPRSNRSYWEPKLAKNVQRDQRVDAALEAAGWSAVHVWEHEEPEAAAERVEMAVRTRAADNDAGPV